MNNKENTKFTLKKKSYCMQLHIFFKNKFQADILLPMENFSRNRHECVANVDITGNDDRFEPHATPR